MYMGVCLSVCLDLFWCGIIEEVNGLKLGRFIAKDFTL